MTPKRLIADRYEVRGILGRGGMGEVYLAYDHRLATDVALKHVPLELSLESGIREALVREARILARLSQTHIVRLFDLADTPDGIFLVLEYVCGPSLDKVLLKRNALSTAELLHIVDHVCPALERAHSLNIFHRDLKPANLLLALLGDEQRDYVRDKTLPPTLLNAEIKVMDFGLAKLVLPSRVEASGVISGTPAFMAPEQFRGELPSVETDIYALGYVAYVCLGGKLPMGTAEVMYFHLMTAPPPLPGVPAYVNAAILKAVSKERKDRFSSALEFAKALLGPAPLPRTATYAIPPPPPPPPMESRPPASARKPASKLWIAFVSVLFAIILLSLTAAFLSRQSSTGTDAQSGRESDSAALSGEMPPLPPLNPSPRIDQPPPPIESARVTRTTEAPPPPALIHPEILARLRVNGKKVLGFGPDGTLYLTSHASEIGAVRNGQLVWQFQLGADSIQFIIAPDGLIWIRDYRDHLFCFNAAGQGGELLTADSKSRYQVYFRKLQPVPSKVQCAGAGPRNKTPIVEPWRTPLDHECEGDPVLGRNGNVLIQTRARTVYSLSSAGSILWTFSAPCPFRRSPLLLSNGTAVALCSSRNAPLIGIADGHQRFSIPAGQGISGPLAEVRDSMFYRFLDSEIYDQHYLALTDSNGTNRWTFRLKYPMLPELALAPDGKICLLDGDFLTIVGDSSH